MKKKYYPLTCVLALVMLVNAVSMTGFAAEKRNITITRDYDLMVTVDGFQVEAHSDFIINAQMERFPFSYNGRTYIALNDLGRILNMNIIWDGASKTISISKKAKPTSFNYIVEGYSRAVDAVKNTTLAYQTKFQATVRPDIKIKKNGVLVQLKNTDGSVVHPITQNGFTYLPVSALGNLFDVAVSWDAKNKTVKLGKDYKWVMLPDSGVNIRHEFMDNQIVRTFSGLGGKDESRRYGIPLTQKTGQDFNWVSFDLNGKYKEIKFETSIDSDREPTVIEVYFDGVLKTKVMAEDPKRFMYKQHGIYSLDHLSYTLDVTGVKELTFKAILDNGNKKLSTVTLGDILLR